MREKAEQAEMVAANLANNLKATGDRDGVVLPVHGFAGGTGTTTFAVNLAWELANIDEGDDALRVCLLDLDLQFGSVGHLSGPAPPRSRVRTSSVTPKRWTATASCRRC